MLAYRSRTGDIEVSPNQEDALRDAATGRRAETSAKSAWRGAVPSGRGLRGNRTRGKCVVLPHYHQSLGRTDLDRRMRPTAAGSLPKWDARSSAREASHFGEWIVKDERGRQTLAIEIPYLRGAHSRLRT